MTKKPNRISRIASAHGLGPEVVGVSSSAPTDGPSGGDSDLVGRGPRFSVCERCWETFRGPHGYRDTCLRCGARLHWEEGALLPDWVRQAYNAYLAREPIDVSSGGWEDEVVERLSAPAPIVVDHLTRSCAERFERVTRKQGLLVTIQWALCGDVGLALRPPAKPHRREVERARNRGKGWGRAWVVEELDAAGQTERQIAAFTGIKKSTVHDIVAKSGRKSAEGESNLTEETQMPDTIVQRVTALEQQHVALRGDFEAHKAEVERQLGLPPGGIEAAEEGLDAFLASIGQERESE